MKRKAGGAGGGTPGKSPSAKRQRKASGGGAKGASRPIKAKKVKSASKVEINGDTSSDDEDHMKKPLLQQVIIVIVFYIKKFFLFLGTFNLEMASNRLFANSSRTELPKVKVELS